MAEWLQLIASLEWLALGIIVFRSLRKWNKKFEKIYTELQEQIGGMNDG